MEQENDLSYANVVRRRAAYLLLSISLLLLLAGVLTDTSWSKLAWTLGWVFIFMGAVMFASVSIVEGAPWLLGLVTRHVEPVWDGELLHTDGSAYKIRYSFDHRGSPWFVASDVCIAIGERVPIQDALKWGGIPLLLFGEYVCFSEANVQAYLVPLAIKNHAANRLLLAIRNNILRKLDKERDAAKRDASELNPSQPPFA
jgi:hypothetical protein